MPQVQYIDEVVDVPVVKHRPRNGHHLASIFHLCFFIVSAALKASPCANEAAKAYRGLKPIGGLHFCAA